jgi:hypothetical protein
MREVIGVVLVGGVLIAGCAAPQRHGPAVTRSFDNLSAEQRDTLWDAAQVVLREHHFRLDRVDRRAGLISTTPQTSQHAFEFWRKDTDTAHDFLEASLRTVRRSVEVAVSPAEVNAGEDEAVADAADAMVTVTVRREYFCTPERQFNSSIAALRMFGNELPRADTGERIIPTDTYWIDAGRDLALERYLLGEILRRGGA